MLVSEDKDFIEQARFLFQQGAGSEGRKHWSQARVEAYAFAAGVQSAPQRRNSLRISPRWNEGKNRFHWASGAGISPVPSTGATGQAQIDADYEKEGSRYIYQSKIFLSNSGKERLFRVVVDIRREPVEIVTVYRTSKIAKYWR